jgi:hypothetical protein
MTLLKRLLRYVRVQLHTVCICAPPPTSVSPRTLMPTGRGARTLAVPRQGSVYTSATPLSPGPPRGSPLCHGPARRLSTVQWQTPLRSASGSGSCSASSIAAS